MALISCPECNGEASDQAAVCPHCGYPLNEPAAAPVAKKKWSGYQWRSRGELLGWPLVSVAVGRDSKTGKLLVAKGIIAIGQFAIGFVTIAQFGIGILLGLGQFMFGFLAIAQFAFGVYFGLGQMAVGLTAIGQFAIGQYVYASLGFGKFVWSSQVQDPQAVKYFQQLGQALRDLM